MEDNKISAEDFGFEEGEADAGPTAGPVFDAEELAEPLPTDEDGYLTPPTLEETTPQESVVVQDFDPADPGAEIAEPQKVLDTRTDKVLRPHDRIARKRARGSRE